MLGPRFCARAFSSCGERGPLLITVRGPLTVAAPPVAGHRLQTRRLSSCGSRAQLLRGMWDLPRPGLEPVSPASAGRLSTTAPPGKPPLCLFIWISLCKIWLHGFSLNACFGLSCFFHSSILIWLLCYVAPADSLECYSAGHRPSIGHHWGNPILILSKEETPAVQINGFCCFVVGEGRFFWGGLFCFLFSYHTPIMHHSLRGTVHETEGLHNHYHGYRKLQKVAYLSSLLLLHLAQHTEIPRSPHRQE